jgi:hypothetical protein
VSPVGISVGLAGTPVLLLVGIAFLNSPSHRQGRKLSMRDGEVKEKGSA